METVLNYLSVRIRQEIIKFLQLKFIDIEEIRIRYARPLAIKTSKQIEILSYIVTIEDITETFQKICENSVYSYKKQICEGFITIKGGHRVGITGNCAIDKGQVVNINYISSLNFRIAKEKIGCSNNILKYIMNEEKKEIYNTLIVSKPGCGKTTILRDLVRNIGNRGKTCGVVDERGEIAAMNKGLVQNDIGVLTDVLDNVTKANGIMMLIRSMAPEVIVCDEIGGEEDAEAIDYAICSGVKGIFSAHGSNIEELLLNPNITGLLKKFVIERIIFLSRKNKGQADKIYYLKERHYIQIKDD